MYVTHFLVLILKNISLSQLVTGISGTTKIQMGGKRSMSTI